MPKRCLKIAVFLYYQGVCACCPQSLIGEQQVICKGWLFWLLCDFLEQLEADYVEEVLLLNDTNSLDHLFNKYFLNVVIRLVKLPVMFLRLEGFAIITDIVEFSVLEGVGPTVHCTFMV